MAANGRHSIRERRLVTRRLISSLAQVHNTCASSLSLLPPPHVFGSSSCSTERGQIHPAVMQIQGAPLRSSGSFLHLVENSEIETSAFHSSRILPAKWRGGTRSGEDGRQRSS